MSTDFSSRSLCIYLFSHLIQTLSAYHTRQCALQCNYLVFRKVFPFCSKSTSPHFDWCTSSNPSVSQETMNNHSSFCLLYIIWDFIGFQFLPSPKLCSPSEKISEPPIILQVWVPNVFIEGPKDTLCFSVPFLEIPSICFAFLPQLNTQLLSLQNSSIIHVFTKYNQFKVQALAVIQYAYIILHFIYFLCLYYTLYSVQMSSTAIRQSHFVQEILLTFYKKLFFFSLP